MSQSLGSFFFFLVLLFAVSYITGLYVLFYNLHFQGSSVSRDSFIPVPMNLHFSTETQHEVFSFFSIPLLIDISFEPIFTIRHKTAMDNLVNIYVYKLQKKEFLG